MSEFDFLSDLSLLDLFRTEVETQAAVLNDGLLSLEKNPRSTDEIDALMRAAHSLKGAARMVGLDSTVDLTHAMEDLFVAVQEGKIELAEGHIDVLFSGVDILADMLQVEEEQMVAWLEERRGRIEEQILCIRALASGPPQDSSDADDQQQVETDGGFPVADRGGAAPRRKLQTLEDRSLASCRRRKLRSPSLPEPKARIGSCGLHRKILTV